MKNTHPPVEYKGRSLGIILLVAAQFLVGLIHVVFGFWLLIASRFGQEAALLGFSPSSDIYSIYTIIFSVLTLFFAFFLWLQKPAGWIGTFAVLTFVIIADSLTLLDLPSIPGIPKFAGYGEITYSILVILFLLQNHVRTKYGIRFSSSS